VKKAEQSTLVCRRRTANLELFIDEYEEVSAQDAGRLQVLWKQRRRFAVVDQ